MESASTASFEAAYELKIIKEKLQNRERFDFLPKESQEEYRKLHKPQNLCFRIKLVDRCRA